MSIEQDYYENEEHWVSSKYSEAETQRIEMLASKIPRDTINLLDVGCGNGLFLRHLATKTPSAFQRLCGVDRSKVALKHVTVEKYQASADLLPFKNREFDLVSSTEVLEHLPQKIFQNALSEISRVAKNWILISVPYDEKISLAQTVCSECYCRFNPNYHLRSFNEERLEGLLRNHGFICRETFKMHPQKKVPDGAEQAIQIIGEIKRALLRQRVPIRPNTICPACGYEEKTDAKDSSPRSNETPRTIGSALRSSLSIVPTHRWIGALYERSR